MKEKNLLQSERVSEKNLNILYVFFLLISFVTCRNILIRIPSIMYTYKSKNERERERKIKFMRHIAVKLKLIH